MLSHVLPGRMLPAPLLIFNEARRNIMQMSLNGAWTPAPKQGHRLPHLPLPPLRLLVFFLCPRHRSICLCPYLPPHLFFFYFLLNAFPYFLISPKLILVFASPGPSSSSRSPFQKARLCHRSPLQTCWLIRR